jgi:hypothetical protein
LLRIEKRFDRVDERFDKIENNINDFKKEVNIKFESINTKIDSTTKWLIGIGVTSLISVFGAIINIALKLHS